MASQNFLLGLTTASASKDFYHPENHKESAAMNLMYFYK